MKRYFYPDEVPEEDFPWFQWGYKGLCAFCGHSDHQQRNCPFKPQKRA